LAVGFVLERFGLKIRSEERLVVKRLNWPCLDFSRSTYKSHGSCEEKLANLGTSQQVASFITAALNVGLHIIANFDYPMAFLAIVIQDEALATHDLSLLSGIAIALALAIIAHPSR
jgi:hypothetical protein